MEVTPGWDGSNLENLWQQLMLLFQHLSTLEQRKTAERPLNAFVSSNSTVSWKFLIAEKYKSEIAFVKSNHIYVQLFYHSHVIVSKSM